MSRTQESRKGLVSTPCPTGWPLGYFTPYRSANFVKSVSNTSAKAIVP